MESDLSVVDDARKRGLLVKQADQDVELEEDLAEDRRLDIIIMFIRITSRTDSTIMKISGAIKTSVRAAVHNYYPKATKEKGTNSTQKTAVAYRFRKEIYRILSCT